jgi:hypothetical protein
MPAGIQITLSPTTPEKNFRIKMEINACAIAAAIAKATPFFVNGEEGKGRKERVKALTKVILN